jgi:oligosaccharide repeat unit polymerase
MIEVLLILFIIATLTIFYKLIKQSISYVNYPLISIVLIFKLLIFAYIGTVIHMVIQGYYTNNYYIVQFLLSSSMLIVLPLGMIVAKKMTSHNSIFEYNYNLDYKISEKMFYIFFGLFLLSIIIFFIFISKLEMLPIIAIFKGLGVSYASELRSASGNTFPGNYYRYAIFMKDLPIYLMLILFFVRNISKRWSILFILVVLFNIFVAIFDIQKAPLMIVFTLLFLSSLFYYKKINWKLTIFGGIGLSILVLLMYSFFLGYGNNILVILEKLFSRIFFAQIDAFIYHQQYIDASGLLYGRSFPNPHGIFPFEHIQTTTEIYKFLHGNWHEGMLFGSFPSVFYADWYDNFGYIGAIFSMFLLGFMVNFLDIKMLSYINKYKSIIIIALYVYFINFFSGYALTSYIGIIVDVHLVFPIVVALCLFYINSYFLKKETV